MHPITLADIDTDLTQALQAGADATTLNQLGDQMDRLDHHPPISLHAAALWYTSQRLHVFPLTPGTKIPFKGSGGCLDATLDPDMINKWWTGNPYANIGLATGHLVDVVDIDGPLGHIEWSREYGETWAGLKILGTVSTPRPGGLHLYVPHKDGIRNGAGLLPGVDYRGAGGYVVAPPSVNEQGAYVWCRPINLTATQVTT